MSKVDHRNKM